MKTTEIRTKIQGIGARIEDLAQASNLSVRIVREAASGRIKAPLELKAALAAIESMELNERYTYLCALAAKRNGVEDWRRRYLA